VRFDHKALVVLLRGIGLGIMALFQNAVVDVPSVDS